jgi:hypothetical protein
MPHRCHAVRCEKEVPPKLLMCLTHWRMVPRRLQRLVWKHYRPGQEIDKRPTREYLDVMKRAIRAVSMVEQIEREP